MNRLLVVISASLLLIGCDKEISRTPLTPREVVKEVDCEKWGFCYHYDYNHGEYRWGLSDNCEGHQSAKIRITPYKSVYESGKESVWEDTETVARYGECR